MSNLPFCFGPDIARITNMCLLSSVQVYRKNVTEKAFTIFCDTKSSPAPRFSFVQYKHADDDDVYYGLVIGIILYTVTKEGSSDDVLLTFQIQRLENICHKEKGSLPLPLYKFAKQIKDKKELQIDAIKHENVMSPVFGIQAYCQHTFTTKKNDIWEISGDRRLYVLDETFVQCKFVADYDFYVTRQNNVRKRVDNLSSKVLMNYNTYMNVDELLRLKKDLYVEERKVKKKKQSQSAKSTSGFKKKASLKKNKEVVNDSASDVDEFDRIDIDSDLSDIDM